MNATFGMFEDTSDVISLQFGNVGAKQYFPGHLAINQDSEGSDGSHINFYATRMGSLSLSEVDYFSIDFDLAIDWINLDGEIRIQPQFYSNGTRVGAVTGNTASYNLDSGDGGMSCNISKTEKNVYYRVAEISGAEYHHFTLLYDLTADSSSQYKLHLYIDGEYIDTHSGFLKAGIDHSTLSLFRLRLYAPDGTECFYYFDNYTITTFETGYTGAISNVANDSSLSLQDCVDSVLYKK